MGLSAGTKLGPYEIQCPIGAGGMGEVYPARDTRLERTVAIKVLPPEFSSDPERRKRFEQRKVDLQPKSPNICVLYDIGRADQTDYLVLEFLDGETLDHRSESSALPLEQMLVMAWRLQMPGQGPPPRLNSSRSQARRHDADKFRCQLLDFGLAKELPLRAGLQSLQHSDLGSHTKQNAHSRRHGAGHSAIHVPGTA